MQCIEDKFEILSTSDFLKELKTKKMLEFENGWADVAVETKEYLGIEIVRQPFAELNDLWEKADRIKAIEIVNRWKCNATDIVDVHNKSFTHIA